MDVVAAPGSRRVGIRRGVTLFGDITTISIHTKTDNVRPGAATRDGVTIHSTVITKRQKYHDVVSSPTSCLLVLGCEVFGRWSEDAIQTVREMAKLKAENASPVLRKSVEFAFSNRWWSHIGIGVQRAIAEALLCKSGADTLTTATAERTSLADVLTDVLRAAVRHPAL